MLLQIREIAEAHRPHSPDPAFWKVWTGEEERTIDWKKISQSWQGLESEEQSELEEESDEDVEGEDIF